MPFDLFSKLISHELYGETSENVNRRGCAVFDCNNMFFFYLSLRPLFCLFENERMGIWLGAAKRHCIREKIVDLHSNAIAFLVFIP
jgi:hypothetical protein